MLVVNEEVALALADCEDGLLFAPRSVDVMSTRGPARIVRHSVCVLGSLLSCFGVLEHSDG